jgi:hypothetical protein
MLRFHFARFEQMEELIHEIAPMGNQNHRR